jgi:hypothetical protein
METKEKKWTDEETAYLTRNHENLTCGEMAKHLGRTLGTVRWKAGVLGLKLEKRDAKDMSRQMLCWSCKRAGNIPRVKPCAWVRNFEPVQGWKAIKNAQGYRVLDCPEFIRSDGGKGK